MGRLQGKKRLLEQSNRTDFQLDDGPVDGNALANKSKLALVLQDAGDLVEARLLHEEVRALVYQLLLEAAVSHSDRNERDSAFNCWSFLLTRCLGISCGSLAAVLTLMMTRQVIAARTIQLGARHMDTLQVGSTLALRIFRRACISVCLTCIGHSFL